MASLRQSMAEKGDGLAGIEEGRTKEVLKDLILGLGRQCPHRTPVS